MRFLFVPLAMIAIGCSSPLSPHPSDALTGTWSDATETLAVGPTGGRLSVPCIVVSVPPLVLDDSLSFQVTGVVVEAGGLVTVHPGSPWPIAGKVIDQRILLVRGGRYAGDTLNPGPGGLHVCAV